MDVFAKSLAPVLGHSEPDVQEWLTTICQRIAEELALNGRVSLGEVGALERVRVPSEPREENGKLSLAPPRHEVRLVQQETSELGIAFDVAVEQLQLSEETAQKLAKGFARVIEKVVEVRGSLKLGELGEFLRGEKGGLTFKQSTILAQLLNEAFAPLAPVTIAERQKPAPIEEIAAPAPLEAKAPSDVARETRSAAPTESPAAAQRAEPPLIPEPSEVPAEPEREPLFVLLSAAAKTKPEKERTEMREKISAAPPPPQPEPNAAPFRYEAQTASPRARQPIAEEELAKPVPTTVEEPVASLDAPMPDRETPLMRNIAIATTIVFLVIIVAFIAMKHETISFTPPAPVDRAKVEAEKAAAAKAEAERVIAEQNIPKKNPAQDSLALKQTGTILKNVTKAAKTLPAELTTIDFAKGGYTLIVASQPTRPQAMAMAEEFCKLGLAATVVEKQVGKTTRYRVRVGQFATAADAAAAKKKYKTVIPADAFLDKVQPAPQENATK